MSNELKKGSKPTLGSHETSGGAGHGEQHGRLESDANGSVGKVKEKARQLQDGASETVRKATDYTRDGVEKAQSWASDTYDQAARRADQAKRRSTSEFARVRKTAEEMVTHNPVMIGVAGLAAGLLIGALLPRTQRENEAFGRLSDDLREQGKRYALDLVREGTDRVVGALDPKASQDEAAHS